MSVAGCHLLRSRLAPEHALRARQKHRAARRDGSAPGSRRHQGGAHGLHRIRRLLAEFGLVFPQSPEALRQVLPGA